MKDTDYWLRIIGATETQKSKIEIYNRTSGNTIYEQSFNIASNLSIQQVSDFAKVDKWVFFVSTKDWVSLVKNASNIPYLANGAYIIDANYKWIIWIWADGNIYLLDNNYSLSYDTYWDNVMLNIVNIAWEKVWSVMYNISAFYMLK